MSVSPAGDTPGRTPNGTAPKIIRRQKPPVDPLVRPKPKRRPQSTAPSNQTGKPNGAPRSKPVSQANTSNSFRYEPHAPGDQPGSFALFRAAGSNVVTSGFSSEPAKDFVDIPLVISRRMLKEGFRSHVARFSSKQKVDLNDEDDFTRPVRLHRRDPNAPAPGAKPVELGPKDAAMEAERQQQEEQRAQREVAREALMSEVAPSVNNPHVKRGHNAKPKTQQVWRKDETAEQQAATRLKYEESLPWHLEDFDNKQTWVGSYEAALSETYAQLAYKDGKFSAVPLEKWYKFTQQRRLNRTEEELIAANNRREIKNAKLDFIAREEEKKKSELEEERNKKAMAGLFVGRPGTDRIKEEEDLVEGLDFEEDVADDEEDAVIEGDDEDAKHAQTRIKKDQLKANIFNMKEEKEYDEDERLERRQKEALKSEGKRVRRALKRRERNYIYDSDSDHMYSDESDSSSSETDRVKEEQAKKEAEEKKPKSSQTGSGASTKGTNTPSSRASKHPDASQRKLPKGIKRNGSPSLSEASGNESARKKQKKGGPASRLGTGTSTPNGPPSRPRSPLNPPPSSDPTSNRSSSQTQPQKKPAPAPAKAIEKKRPRAGAGSGSEAETAGSGGDMSDGARKKIKIDVQQPNSKKPSPNNSTTASRAVSQDRTAAPLSGARDGSSVSWIPPSAAEIKAAIPEKGATIAEILNIFSIPSGKKEIREQFFKTMKTVTTWDKNSKLLRPTK